MLFYWKIGNVGYMIIMFFGASARGTNKYGTKVCGTGTNGVQFPRVNVENQVLVV